MRVTSKAIVALTRSGGVVAWGDAVTGAPDESSFQDHVVKNACASRASAIPSTCTEKSPLEAPKAFVPPTSKTTDLPQLRRQDLIASWSRKCCLQQQGMEAHVDRASNKEHHILLADFPSHR